MDPVAMPYNKPRLLHSSWRFSTEFYKILKRIWIFLHRILSIVECGINVEHDVEFICASYSQNFTFYERPK